MEKLAFETVPHRGLFIRAYYLEEGSRESRIEIWMNKGLVQRGFVPSYKIWNYYAHSRDIIDEYLDDSPNNGQEG
jgi:hypothetical protein